MFGRWIFVHNVEMMNVVNFANNGSGVLSGALQRFWNTRQFDGNFFFLEGVYYCFWTKSHRSFHDHILLDCLDKWWNYSVSYETI